jgi:hypothetical protein
MDQVHRHGHGTVNLPKHRRGSWRKALGHPRNALWHRLPVHNPDGGERTHEWLSAFDVERANHVQAFGTISRVAGFCGRISGMLFFLMSCR